MDQIFLSFLSKKLPYSNALVTANAGNGNIMLLNQINYHWRMLATGLSFFVFGLGGLFLSILVFPLLWVLVWKRNLRIVLARHIIRFSFRFFIEFMSLLGVLCYD